MTLTPIAKCLGVELLLPSYFNDLSLSLLGFDHPTFCLWGERYNPLHHRRYYVQCSSCITVTDGTSTDLLNLNLVLINMQRIDIHVLNYYFVLVSHLLSRDLSLSNLLMTVSALAHYKHHFFLAKNMSSTKQIHKTHQEIIKDNILISHVKKKKTQL